MSQRLKFNVKKNETLKFRACVARSLDIMAVLSSAPTVTDFFHKFELAL